MAHTVEPPTDHPTSIVVRVKGDPIAASLSPEIELDLSKFHNGRWALQLDHGLAWRETPVVIVAYGLACHAVAWWAQLSPRSYLRAISGALFLAPLRVGRDLPGAAAAMENGPRYRLPFASIVVGDTWFAVQETLALADRWGSGFVATGEPQPGPISNRHAPLGAIEQMLLERVGLFDAGVAATPPFAGVVPPHDSMPRG